MKLIKVYAKVALQKEPEFVGLIEETGKHLEDSIKAAKSFRNRNKDMPIYEFSFREVVGIGSSVEVYNCDYDFNYMGK